MKANLFLTLINKYIIENQDDIKKIIKIKPNQRNFQNTVRALQKTNARLFNRCNPISFLSLVSPDKEIRESSSEAKKLFEKTILNNASNLEIFNVLEEFKSHNKIEDLDKEDQVLFKKYHQDFLRLGLNLEKEKREEVSKLRLKINELSLQFNKNVNDDTTTVQLNKEELEGMPSSFLDSLELKDGKYDVTLRYPHLFPILEQCKISSTRKKMLETAGNKCVDKNNVDTLKEVLKLRNEAAKLLGFKSDSHFMLDIKLVKTPENAIKFLEQTSQLLEPILKEEMQHMLKLKEEETKERKEEFDGKINLYDINYYQKRRLKEKYNIDDEVIREYFPFDKVIQGVFSVYESVLRLSFVKQENADVWHKEVLCYSVFDSENKEYLGNFYLDLFPRDGKYSHAACWPVTKRQIDDDEPVYTSSAMVTNFSPPTSNLPSLLRFSEVQTFFHEFGHVMHSVLCKSKYERCNWAWDSVEHDFLEVPSMSFENWSFKEEVLVKCSSHYKSGEPLPKSIIENLSASAVANEGYGWRRLIGMSMFDLCIHGVDGHLQDLESNWQKYFTKYSTISPLAGTQPYSSFMHLTTGYNAGYYSYLYSEVIAQDVFSLFESEGILNQQVGLKFRKFVLEKSCLEEGNQMILDFLGRDFNQKAFLKRLGI